MTDMNLEKGSANKDGAAVPPAASTVPPAVPNAQHQPSQGPQGSEAPQGEATVPTTGLGIAGLVLGILAVPPAFIPLINFLSLPLAIIGAILAAVGLSGVKKGKAKGKGIALAGLVLSIIAIVVFVVMYGSAAAVSGVGVDSSASAPTQQNAATQSESGSSGGQNAAKSVAEDADAEQTEYAVKIVGARLGKDYSDDPVIIVTYKWQNNSDDKTSFAAALYPKCYQDGVQLETGVSSDADTSGYLADVKPGHGTTVEIAYELKNKKDDVEVEVGPLINFDDTVYASKTFSMK